MRSTRIVCQLNLAGEPFWRGRTSAGMSARRFVHSRSLSVERPVSCVATGVVTNRSGTSLENGHDARSLHRERVPYPNREINRHRAHPFDLATIIAWLQIAGRKRPPNSMMAPRVRVRVTGVYPLTCPRRSARPEIQACAGLFESIPPLISGHACAAKGFGQDKEHPSSECQRALRQQEGFFLIGTWGKPGFCQEPRLSVRPFGRLSQSPPAGQMLANSADKSVGLGMSEKGWFGRKTRNPGVPSSRGRRHSS